MRCCSDTMAFSYAFSALSSSNTSTTTEFADSENTSSTYKYLASILPNSSLNYS